MNLEEKIKEHLKEGLSIRDIATHCNVTQKTVRLFVKKLKKENTTVNKCRVINLDESLIVSEYQSGITVTEIAKKYKVTRKTINKILNDNGVTLRTGRRTKVIDESLIVSEYQSGITVREIGNKFKIYHGTVSKILKKHNVKCQIGRRKTERVAGTESKKNVYWYAIQESKVIEFILTDDSKIKSIIFEKHLYNPLLKMAEIILRRYFSGNVINPVHAQECMNDAISHVAIRLNKFNLTKSKSKNPAYTFCQTVIKNFYYEYFLVQIGRAGKKNFLTNRLSIDNQVDETIDNHVYKSSQDNPVYDFEDITKAIQLINKKINRERDERFRLIYEMVRDLLMLTVEGIYFNNYATTYFIKLRLKINSTAQLSRLTTLAGYRSLFLISNQYFNRCEKIGAELGINPQSTLKEVCEAFSDYEVMLNEEKINKEELARKRYYEKAKKRKNKETQTLHPTVGLTV